MTYTPQALCGLLAGALNGIPVVPPGQFGFPSLGGGGAQNNLGTHATGAMPAGAGPGVVRAVGLITCASVIYRSNAGAVHVHHANAGDVSAGNFAAAIAAVGGVAANVCCVYAHNNATDAGYTQTVADLVLWGIPHNQIVEITHLRMPCFGINHLGWLGY